MCLGCKISRPLTLFYTKGKNRPNDFQSYCKECQHKQSAAWNRTHRDWVNAWEKEWRKKKYGGRRASRYFWEQVQVVEEYLDVHPCVDCGEADVVVLEFDHVRGKKLCNVKRMVWLGCSMEMLLEEIAKCDVRCANCHRRRTHKRKRTWNDIYI